MVKKLERDVKPWDALPLTMLGRATMAKMIAFPQLLYTLQNCPYRISEGLFEKIDSQMRSLL